MVADTDTCRIQVRTVDNDRQTDNSASGRPVGYLLFACCFLPFLTTVCRLELQSVPWVHAVCPLIFLCSPPQHESDWQPRMYSDSATINS